MVYSLVPSRQSSGFPGPHPESTTAPVALVPPWPVPTYLVSDEEHLKNGNLQGMGKPSLQTWHPQRETDRVKEQARGTMVSFYPLLGLPVTPKPHL